jgi:membrane fusion protein (multidrug efflux system)
MKQPAPSSTTRKVVRGIAVAFGFTVIVVLLMLWLIGYFHPKIDETGTQAAPGRPVGDAKLAEVRTILVPRIETAVGTIRAVHEASVASKLLAKVTEVRVVAGQAVSRGEVLVQLDDADLRARLQQAEAQAERARVEQNQAQIEYDRVTRLFAQQSAAKLEMDRVTTALRTAETEVSRTQEGVKEAQTILDYATIRSPIDGIVVDKRIEAGDTASPGQVLVALYDPTRMQLVASVRESLTRRLLVGETIGVHVDALDKTCQGRISEIVPEAESATRSFQVKVTGPCPPGIYTGMFGRLLIPLDKEAVLVIPQAAVLRVGQLEVVDVVEGNTLRRRAVRLGRSFDADVQVLAGLREGEQVMLNPTAEPQS